MKSNEKYVLAVDLGTSGPKTAIVSVYGEVIGSEFEDTPVILLPDGGAEQDPQGWWNAILNTAKRVIGKSGVSSDDIVAVSVTSQWSGTVAVDEAGNHLMNAIIWMDSRGAGDVQDVFGGLLNISGYSLYKALLWQKYTGALPTLTGKDPAGHILWLKKNRPEIYRAAYKFLEPKDYLNLRFTGRFTATYDSILLHWLTDNRNPSRVVYCDKLLKMIGFDRSKLPDLIQALEIVGPVKKEIAAELGLKEETPVIGGTPDVPSAGVGSGAVRDFEGHLYIGTSSWISAHVPFKKTDISNNLGSFPSPVPGRYLILCEQECAGKCLTWLRDNVLYHKDELMREECAPDIYKVMDKIVGRVPAGANKVIFTPWLYGERSPVDDCRIRSSIFNLSLENTREDLVRAVYEGVAFNAKWLLTPVEKFMGRPFEYLNFIGGGANSDVWSQIFADILDRKIRQVKDPIYSNVRGAAFLAAMALGRIRLEDIPQYVQIKAEYTPNPDNREVYDELFKEFTVYYNSQKKACARMNQQKEGTCAL
ncbi:MAG: FGGY-family carbohydrate kinase [Smithellaceae bacterium]|nr:FGGY-family carbohydrate kinase [Smithellaceae bacterium]